MMKKSRCNCCKFLPYPFTPGKLLLGIGREVASVHWYSLEPFQELIYYFLSKPKGQIWDDVAYPLNKTLKDTLKQFGCCRYNFK